MQFSFTSPFCTRVEASDAAPGGQSPASLYDALMERSSSFSSLLSAAEPSASPPGARDDDDDASVDYANVFAA